MREILRDLQFEIPFSTFAPVLREEGQNPSLNLGASCLGLSRELKARLEHAGHRAMYIAEGKDAATHYAVVVEEGELFLADASMLQMEPINISKCLRERGEHEFKAYPIIKGKPSKIVIDVQGPTKFDFRKYNCSASVPRLIVEHSFDLKNVMSEAVEEGNPAFTKGIKNVFLLRVLDSDGSMTAISQFTKTRLRAILKMNETGESSKRYGIYDKGFEEDIQELAEKLGTDSWTLIAHFDSAQRAISKRKA